MYPQAQYGTQTMPNPYVTSVQPVNMSQTGIGFDQIRNDIANLVMAQQNVDEAYRLLASDCYGEGRNWNTGRMAQLTKVAAMTVDLFQVSQPQIPLQQNYASALQEVMNFAWVQTIDNYQNLLNHPTVFPKQGQYQSLKQAMAQRYAQFQQAGLLNNNAVQPVPQNQVWQPVGGQPMNTVTYNQFGQPVTTNMGYQTAPAMGGYGTSMTQARPINAGNTYTFANTNQNVVQNTNTMTESQRVNVYAERERNRQAVANGARVDKYGIPIEDDAPTNVSQPVQQTQTKPQSTSQFAEFSHVPEPKKPVLPTVPVNPEVVSGINKMRSQLEKELKEHGGHEFDLMDSTLWEEVKQHDGLKPEERGLEEDEVKHLTRKEREILLHQGIKFEKPYTNRLTADPRVWHLFCVLTKNNEIRQVLVKIGEPMKRDVHMDILADARRVPLYNSDPAKKHDTFFTTTQGGILSDPFKTSPVVLRDEFNDIQKTVEETPEISDEEIEFMKNEAFAKYEEAIDDDINKAVEPPAELELSDEEANEYRKKRINSLTENTITEALINSSLVDMVSTTNEYLLETHNPGNDRRIFHRDTVVERIPCIFDTEGDKDYAEACLEDFYWEQTEEGQEKPALSGMDYRNKLNKLQNEIPTGLWHLLNNKATETVNKNLKYLLGFDITIDNFVEDYPDLHNYIQELEEVKHRFIAYALLDTAVCNSLRIFHPIEGMELVVPGSDDLDFVKLRGLTTRQIVANTLIPGLPCTFGLMDDQITVTPETHPDIYRIAASQIDRRMDSYLNTSKEGYLGPITESYLVFADGTKYRAVPYLGDSTDEQLYNQIVLIKVPDNV